VTTDLDLEVIKACCSTVATCAVGDLEYVLMTGLRLPGCIPAETDALLCLGDRGEGYATRLFFPVEVKPPRPYVLNWNTKGVHILGRSWFAFSWKVPQGHTVVETLNEHLKPLR
jgi:hypothetical protein